MGVAIGLYFIQNRKFPCPPTNTYAAVVAVAIGPIVLVGMEKSPKGLLTQMFLSTRVSRLLKYKLSARRLHVDGGCTYEHVLSMAEFHDKI